MMILDDGEPQTLQSILDARQWRQDRQRSLVHDFPGACVVSVKMNIPGAVKTNDAIRAMYQSAACDLCSRLSAQHLRIVESHFYVMRPTGPEGFLVVDGGSLAVKTSAIEFEEDYCTGRLFDIDIVGVSGRQLSRSNLGLAPRKCFVCELPAKECARSGRHTAQQVGQAVERYYGVYRNGLRANGARSQ